MAITRTLPNFPLLNQLSEPSDGTPDQNSRDNCVAASLADALNWYLGYGRYWGDELTDSVYGAGYTGPESAERYVAFCDNLGFTLAPYANASQAGLTAKLHACIAAGIPALVTMPSNWNTPYADPCNPSGSTHVGVCCGDGDAMLRVMNPWGGFWQDESDEWWQERLCYGQVWPITKNATKGGSPMSGVPQGWKDDGSTLTAPNGKTAVQGFRYLVEQTAGWLADLQPIGPAYGIGGSNTRQDFAISTGWDGKNLFLTAAPALVHADQLAAAQNTISELRQQVTQLQAQLAAAQAAQPAPTPTPVTPTATDEEVLALALFRNAVILFMALSQKDPQVAAAVAGLIASPAVAPDNTTPAAN